VGTGDIEMKKIIYFTAFTLLSPVQNLMAQELAKACEKDVVRNNCIDTVFHKDGAAIYTGEFLNNKAHGYGVFIQKDGAIYAGQFVDDKRSGSGTYKFGSGPNKGASYSGDYIDGAYNGQGVWTFPDGRKYVGAFKSNAFDGFGVVELKDASKFVGSFKANKYDGYGTIYSPQSTVVKQGMWREGVFIEDQNKTETDNQNPTAIQAATARPNVSPLKCSSGAGAGGGKAITCTVGDNNLKVTDVVLNRGNCASPFMTPQDKVLVEKYLNNYPADKRKQIETQPMAKLGIIISMVDGKLPYTQGYIFQTNRPLFDALNHWATDESGTYKFGDRISISITCPNLIEYSITANGHVWTWNQ